MAETNNPKRILSVEQTQKMLQREEVVLKERTRGKSFYKISNEHPAGKAHSLDGEPCHCGGLANSQRIWRRAIGREDNINYRRAEAIRLEETRLDELQDGLWDRAMSGDARAVEVTMKVLERRARMLGLDFADEISGRLVEVEQAKVKLMATALVKALEAIGTTDEQRRTATASFFAELRAAEEQLPAPSTVQLNPEDEDLL